MLDVEISELKAEVVKLRDDKEENKLKTQDVSPEDRKIDEFLDLVQKKSVSDGIRQRNKKLQRESRSCF
ncbi:6175_t:CDS:2 [Rhizophagus irregularis]|nr:6175_t:CDS:2 [Rhizophagus irregularis]